MPIIRQITWVDPESKAELATMIGQLYNAGYEFQFMTETHTDPLVSRGSRKFNGRCDKFATSWHDLKNKNAVMAAFLHLVDFQVTPLPTKGGELIKCVAVLDRKGNYKMFLQLDDYCGFYRTHRGKVKVDDKYPRHLRRKGEGDIGGVGGRLPGTGHYDTVISGDALAEAYHLRTSGRV